jgi:hypothetical protein
MSISIIVERKLLTKLSRQQDGDGDVKVRRLSAFRPKALKARESPTQ